MNKLMTIEQNNEILHQQLLQSVRQLEAVTPNITEEYEEFYQSISKVPIEERSFLLMIISHLIVKLREQLNKERQKWLKNLSKYETSIFAQMLSLELKNDYVEALAWLKNNDDE